MNKRARIEAALQGRIPDRVPFGMWLHNFAEENSDAALANETTRLYERFDFDFIKPQSRPYCFAQMWGQEFKASSHRDTLPQVTRFVVRGAGDLQNINAVAAGKGALEEQIRAFRMIRRVVGNEVPIIATIFSPLTNMTLMHEGGFDSAQELTRTAPESLERALTNMGKTLRDYARMCIDEGVDGIFYACTTGNHGQASDEEFERFQRPLDELILEGAHGGSMNVLHMCGTHLMAERFKDYNVHAFSWGTTPNNPTLRQMHAMTGKAVLGGAPGKPSFGSMDADELFRHVTASLAEMDGRNHILGPDCSINSNSPPSLIDVVAEAAKSYRIGFPEKASQP